MLSVISSSRNFCSTCLRSSNIYGSGDTASIIDLNMTESLLATSTPDSEATRSTYQQRKHKQAQGFLTGTSRAAYRPDPLLE